MSRRSRVGLVATGVAAVCLGAAFSGTASTYASFSDSGSVHAWAGAGVWAPDPPAACGPISSYRSIVWGTVGNDVLGVGNHPQIIMGLAGNDTITGSNSGDCLVGGPGNDRLLGGNAKDILIGGPGDDYLSGGNAKDDLDGSEDVDVCDGGNGKDTVIGCEYAETAAVPREEPPAPRPAHRAEDTSAAMPSGTPATHEDHSSGGPGHATPGTPEDAPGTPADPGAGTDRSPTTPPGGAPDQESAPPPTPGLAPPAETQDDITTRGQAG